MSVKFEAEDEKSKDYLPFNYFAQQCPDCENQDHFKIRSLFIPAINAGAVLGEIPGTDIVAVTCAKCGYTKMYRTDFLRANLKL